MKKINVEEALQYAAKLEPNTFENGGMGLSHNEERIVVLAAEVKRLRSAAKARRSE